MTINKQPPSVISDLNWRNVQDYLNREILPHLPGEFTYSLHLSEDLRRHVYTIIQILPLSFGHFTLRRPILQITVDETVGLDNIQITFFSTIR